MQSELRTHATALADAVEGALAAWVERSVVRVATDARREVSRELLAEARRAGQAAEAEIGPEIRSLLELDIDRQPTGPLALLRRAALYPTAVLASAGFPPVPRDPDQVRMMPDDIYDLAPASFADVDPDLTDLGIAWGAAKAWEHLRRHSGPASSKPNSSKPNSPSPDSPKPDSPKPDSPKPDSPKPDSKESQ